MRGRKHGRQFILRNPFKVDLPRCSVWREVHDQPHTGCPVNLYTQLVWAHGLMERLHMVRMHMIRSLSLSSTLASSDHSLRLTPPANDPLKAKNLRDPCTSKYTEETVHHGRDVIHGVSAGLGQYVTNRRHSGSYSVRTLWHINAPGRTRRDLRLPVAEFRRCCFGPASNSPLTNSSMFWRPRRSRWRVISMSRSPLSNAATSSSAV